MEGREVLVVIALGISPFTIHPGGAPPLPVVPCYAVLGLRPLRRGPLHLRAEPGGDMKNNYLNRKEAD